MVPGVAVFALLSAGTLDWGDLPYVVAPLLVPPVVLALLLWAGLRRVGVPLWTVGVVASLTLVALAPVDRRWHDGEPCGTSYDAELPLAAALLRPQDTDFAYAVRTAQPMCAAG